MFTAIWLFVFLFSCQACHALRQVVYISNTPSPFGLTEQEKKDIILTCRKNNKQYGITGILLSHESSIVQVIEGPADAVQIILNKIMLDSRHRSVITILDHEVEHRSFAGWEMAFRDMTYTKELEEWAERQDFIDFHTEVAQDTPLVRNRKVAVLLDVYQRILLGWR